VPAPHNAKQNKTIAIFSVRGMNRLQLYCTPSLQSFSQSAQVSKAINSSAVSVGPARLQRVTAYEIETGEAKTLVRISHLGPRDITKHVGFATARRARTCASQRLKFEKRFRAVIPRDRELAAYLLNVCWLESHLIFWSFRSFTENCRTHAHQRSSFLNCDPKILCHAH
jgi:hypothetical protein